MSSSSSNQVNPCRALHLHWVAVGNALLLAIFFLLIDLPDAHAQIGQLQVGDRVRITAPLVQSSRIKGTVTELDESVLVLSVKGSSFYISESLIQNLETSIGKKRVVGRGLLIGAVSGTISFGMLAAFTNNACGFSEDCILANRNGEAFLTGATAGLVIGGAAGAVAGFIIKVDQWERVRFGIAMDATPVPSNFNERKASPTLAFRFSFGK